MPCMSCMVKSGTGIPFSYSGQVNEQYKAYKTHKNDLTCLACLVWLNQEQVYRFLIPVR